MLKVEVAKTPALKPTRIVPISVVQRELIGVMTGNSRCSGSTFWIDCSRSHNAKL
jgi:hypothetical protein